MQHRQVLTVDAGSDCRVEMVGGDRGSWLRRSTRRDILEQKRLKCPFESSSLVFPTLQGHPHAAGELRSGARQPARASPGADERHGHRSKSLNTSSPRLETIASIKTSTNLQVGIGGRRYAECSFCGFSGCEISAVSPSASDHSLESVSGAELGVKASPASACRLSSETASRFQGSSQAFIRKLLWGKTPPLHFCCARDEFLLTITLK